MNSSCTNEDLYWNESRWTKRHIDRLTIHAGLKQRWIISSLQVHPRQCCKSNNCSSSVQITCQVTVSDISQRVSHSDLFTSTNRVHLFLQSLLQDVRREFELLNLTVLNICLRIDTWSERHHVRNMLWQEPHRPWSFHPPRWFVVVEMSWII